MMTATDYDGEIAEIIDFIHSMAESELDPRKHQEAFNILENLLLELRSIALKAGRSALVDSADKALSTLSKTLDEGCPFTDTLR